MTKGNDLRAPTAEQPPDKYAKGLALSVVLVVLAVLYFARTIFIPLAFSILVTFMLAPLVIRLRHWGLGRIPSTAIVVLVSFGILSVFGGIMASQLADLAHKLPEYQHNIEQKIESIRSSGGGVIKRFSGSVQRFTDALTPAPPPATHNQPPEDRPVPVEIRRSPFSGVELIQKILGSVLGVLLNTGIVIVFVIFMLIQLEDLRDRLIRLAGSKRVHLTTNVLDDAATRVSRYLLAQFLVNFVYGFVTGTALYFIHVPNPLLWGMMAALFRYVPYLGIWVAATLPAAVALAVRPGWMDVPIVFGVYMGVDLLMYNLVEPLLYGSSTGLSPLAVLVAAVFWTWLWGAAGLLLATPLTVCVVVIGHHVPNLEFLRVLLSDEPVLKPKTRLYQRMLAMDAEEAGLVAEQYLKDKTLEQLYDDVIVPALTMAEEDRHRGRLDEDKEQYIFQNTRILVEDVAERCEELLEKQGEGSALVLSNTGGAEKIVLPNNGPVQMVCIPARDTADELAAFMLSQLLQKRGFSVKALNAGLSPAAVIQEVESSGAPTAFVTAVPPFAYMHIRYICRRLRNQFKDLKLVAVFLTESQSGYGTHGPSVVDFTVSSLAEAVSKAPSTVQAAASQPAMGPEAEPEPEHQSVEH
ncbi:MAG TPA: AI-2E family transporter [Verrucomicrobiae bacterium]|nr:AI-2E family transporter [Verrucomicrobiae bacterium]